MHEIIIIAVIGLGLLLLSKKEKGIVIGGKPRQEKYVTTGGKEFVAVSIFSDSEKEKKVKEEPAKMPVILQEFPNYENEPFFSDSKKRETEEQTSQIFPTSPFPASGNLPEKKIEKKYKNITIIKDEL